MKLKCLPISYFLGNDQLPITEGDVLHISRNIIKGMEEGYFPAICKVSRIEECAHTRDCLSLDYLRKKYPTFPNCGKIYIRCVWVITSTGKRTDECKLCVWDSDTIRHASKEEIETFKLKEAAAQL